MPLPKPHKGEAQDAFMARCMHEAYGSGAPEDRTQEQAVAMCYSAWREVHGGSAPKSELEALIAKWKEFLARAKVGGEGCPEPEDDETREDYMDRCTEDYDE